MIQFVSYIPGGSGLVDDFVLRMNRAAEDAAKEAKPIFVAAITTMTIEDGLNILLGEDTAATHYLRTKTFLDLKGLFKPKINASLEKDLVGGISANDSWNSLSNAFNNYVVDTWVGTFYGLQPVQVQMDEYVTHRALSGLFVKVAEEEKDIRTDPVARVNEILQKVFGSLDQP
jgi:hypothetical protein